MTPKPEDPDKNNPDKNNGSQNGQNNSKDSVKTGDQTALLTTVFVSAISLLGIYASIKMRKRKN